MQAVNTCVEPGLKEEGVVGGGRWKWPIPTLIEGIPLHCAVQMMQPAGRQARHLEEPGDLPLLAPIQSTHGFAPSSLGRRVL